MSGGRGRTIPVFLFLEAYTALHPGVDRETARFSLNEYLRTTDVHDKPSKNIKWKILCKFFGEKATARQKAAHEQDEHNLEFEKPYNSFIIARKKPHISS